MTAIEDRYEYDMIIPKNVPSNASQAIQAQYMSLSIEVRSFPRLLGSVSTPQVISRACLELFKALSGAYPDIRVTGMDTYGVQFVDDSRTAIAETTNQYGNRGMLLDPTWLEWFKLYPPGVTFTIGLPLMSVLKGSAVQLQSLLGMAKAVVEEMPERLTAFELGNEPDQQEGYTGNQYTADFLHYASMVRREVLLPASIKEPKFVFGTLAREYKDTFTIPELALAGANSSMANDLIESFSNHKYPFNNCNNRNEYTIADLLNRRESVYYGLYNPIKSMGEVFDSGWHGMALGEVNSICCGQGNVTNSFANAVWMVDYALYGAFNNITRMSIHFGDLISYAPWLPADATIDNKAIVHPTFYGMLLVSEALGSSNDSTVTLMDWNNRHIFYAIHSQDVLRSIVIVNTDMYNSTFTSARSDIIAHLHTSQPNTKIRAKLLTADYADSISGFNYDGLSYDDSRGKFFDTKQVAQYIQTDSLGALDVEVGASQVMLLSFVDTLSNAELLAQIQAAVSSATVKLATPPFADTAVTETSVAFEALDLSNGETEVKDIKVDSIVPGTQSAAQDLEAYRPRGGQTTVSQANAVSHTSWSTIIFMLIIFIGLWQLWAIVRRSRTNRNKLH